jgi:hypothetical protein
MCAAGCRTRTPVSPASPGGPGSSMCRRTCAAPDKMLHFDGVVSTRCRRPAATSTHTQGSSLIEASTSCADLALSRGYLVWVSASFAAGLLRADPSASSSDSPKGRTDGSISTIWHSAPARGLLWESVYQLAHRRLNG